MTELKRYDVATDQMVTVTQEWVDQADHDRQLLAIHRNVMRRVACLKTWEDAPVINEIYKLLDKYSIPHVVSTIAGRQ